MEIGGGRLQVKTEPKTECNVDGTSFEEASDQADYLILSYNDICAYLTISIEIIFSQKLFQMKPTPIRPHHRKLLGSNMYISRHFLSNVYNVFSITKYHMTITSQRNKIGYTKKRLHHPSPRNQILFVPRQEFPGVFSNVEGTTLDSPLLGHFGPPCAIRHICAIRFRYNDILRGNDHLSAILETPPKD